MTTPLATHLAHFRWRVLQDALAEGTATYWERRAEQLEQAAQSAPGDYLGAIFDPQHPAYAAATNRDRALAKAEHTRRARALAATAKACRHHAQLLRDTGLDAEAQAAITNLLVPNEVA